jgi:hypothetical protein
MIALAIIGRFVPPQGWIAIGLLQMAQAKDDRDPNLAAGWFTFLMGFGAIGRAGGVGGVAEEVATAAEVDLAAQESAAVEEVAATTPSPQAPLDTVVGNDGIATWVKVPGDPKAFARIVEESGALHVTDIFRGGLPPGAGSQILAEGLKAAGVRHGQTVVFEGVINTETIAAARTGQSAANSLLGRLGAKALRALGLEPANIEYQVMRGKLAVIIMVK